MPKNYTEMLENHLSIKDISYNNLITEELIKNGLQNDKGKNAELLSWEIKDFTKKGDGYTSLVTSVTVHYVNDGTKSEISYVVKLNPQRPPSLLTNCMKEMFPREIVILRDVVGGMNKHLERLSLSPIRTPKVYASTMERGKEAFVAENLRTQGFQMHERKKGQDIHHALLVMEEFGRFHASSLLLEESLAPKTFLESFEYFEESWLDIHDKYFKVFTNTFVSTAEGAITYLSAIPKYAKCVKWLKENKQNFGRNYIEGFVSKKPFEVLVHGDSHTNNMLFKYNSKNEVVDMRFVDLQCTRVGSPASDISYFAYTSLTREVRAKHFQKLLSTYYQSFSNVLLIAQRKVPFTFKELEEEVEKRKSLGLIMGLAILPYVLFEGEDEVIDIGELKEENMEELAKMQRENFRKQSEKEGPFKDRFLSLLDDFLENSFFDNN